MLAYMCNSITFSGALVGTLVAREEKLSEFRFLNIKNETKNLHEQQREIRTRGEVRCK